MVSGCEGTEDTDTLTGPECEELMAAIYDECKLALPENSVVDKTRDEALWDCREDQDLDWACIDECVAEEGWSCFALNLCLKDCE